MINDLSATLKAIVDVEVKTHVAFERPYETYVPSTSTINLFLYDIRENIELRSNINETIMDREKGIAIISRPPLRLACSYLVTAWIDPGIKGEIAILNQHELLGAVLKVFSRMPTIEDDYLQGELKKSLYPVSLVTAQGDLMRNPSEFWAAIGGKLRPSFTVTATIAIDQNAPTIEEHLVSTKHVVLGEKLADEADFKDKQQADVWFEIGGVITDMKTAKLLDNVEVTLLESGKKAITDATGQYRFSGLKEGKYKARFVKENYSTVVEQVLVVPGKSPTAFDIKLSPI